MSVFLWEVAHMKAAGVGPLARYPSMGTHDGVGRSQGGGTFREGSAQIKGCFV